MGKSTISVAIFHSYVRYVGINVMIIVMIRMNDNWDA